MKMKRRKCDGRVFYVRVVSLLESITQCGLELGICATNGLVLKIRVLTFQVRSCADVEIVWNRALSRTVS